jgi:hypothetical protein
VAKQPINDSKIFNQGRSFPPARRLIVLIPDFQTINQKSLGRLIWGLASPRKCAVLYLSIVDKLYDEILAAHKLTRLAASTNDRFVHVDIMVEIGIPWLRIIKQISRPGDVLICFEDHFSRNGMFRRKPISAILADQLDLPVYVLGLSENIS